jgi:hypothetical protein
VTTEHQIQALYDGVFFGGLSTPDQKSMFQLLVELKAQVANLKAVCDGHTRQLGAIANKVGA